MQSPAHTTPVGARDIVVIGASAGGRKRQAASELLGQHAHELQSERRRCLVIKSCAKSYAGVLHLWRIAYRCPTA